MSSSAENDDSFIEEAFAALEEARGTPEEGDRRTEFYNAGGNFLLSHTEHWWCRYSQLMTEMTRVLEFVGQQASIDALWREMCLQLLSCTSCVDHYHEGLEQLKAVFE